MAGGWEKEEKLKEEEEEEEGEQEEEDNEEEEEKVMDSPRNALGDGGTTHRQSDRQTDRHTVILTYRLNWLRGAFSETLYKISSLFIKHIGLKKYGY